MEYSISSKTWCEISAAKLRSNFAALASVIPSDVLKMAVVKSNAYGHGIVECAEIFADAGCDWLGVDDIDEAVLLRKNGISLPILVLGTTLTGRLDDAKKYTITITCSTFEMLKICAESGVSVHLKIDTGLGRQGFTADVYEKLVTVVTSCPDIVSGIFSHLAAAELESQDDFTFEQYQKLSMLKQKICTALGKDIIHHIAASAGSILHPPLHSNMVRFGISLYGLWPSPDTKKRSNIVLQPALSWKAIISETKYLPAGHTVGYDRTHVLDRNSTIAIIPVGYWHGISRQHSSKGFVLIGSIKAPILGRVSMDMIIVDVTDIPETFIGQEVVIIGDGISAEDFAVAGDTINYEAVTCINPLIERKIVS